MNCFAKRFTGALLVLLLGLSGMAWGQVVAWETADLAGNEITVNATTNDANLNTSVLSRGAGINASALANAFSSTNFTASGDRSDAITNNKYLQFSISAKESYRVSLSTLNVNFRRSSTGPNTFQWQYSLDGFSTAGINIASEISYTGTESNGLAQAQIALSGISALQNVESGTTITIRLYGWGASQTGGTFAIGRLTGNDLAIGGTVDLIPGANEAPVISNIAHDPATDITSSTTVSVSADVTDDVSVDLVELRWGTAPETYDYTINMSVGSGDTYTTDTDIPAQTDGTTVYYVIYAEDNEEASRTSAEQSYTVSDPKTTTLPYAETFDSDLGDCYVYNASGETKYWVQTGGYAYMSGYNTGDLEEDWLILPGINLNNYSDEIMTFETWWQYGTDDEDNYLKLLYSTNYTGIGDPSLATWTELTYTQPASATILASSGNIDLSGISGTSVWIAFKYNYSASMYRNWRVDNISIEEVAGPVLTLSTETLSGFSYREGSGPSAEQSFTVSGINLEGNISITPPTNYEISTGTGGAFSATNPITLTQSGGSVGSTSIYVRLKAGLNTGSYNSETITAASTDADNKTVTCNGSVIPTLPFIENFTYEEASLLTNNGWWAHNGAGSEPVTVSSTGLSYNGYVSSNIGRAALLDNTGEDVQYVFESIGSGDLYVSFLVNVTTIAEGYFLHLANGASSFAARVYVKANGENMQFGLSNTSTGNYEETATNFSTATTYLCVVKYDVSVTGACSLWVFSSGVPSSELSAGSPLLTVSGTGVTPISGIALRQYNASQNITVDGIRVATSWNDAPLPICLASFTAAALNGTVKLEWRTESETENAAFRIYRDGEMIAEIEGAGTTTEPHSYAYTDQYVIPGKTYSYQLADVSFDGEETKHNEVEVKVEIEYVDRDYSIGAAYPNPFNPLTIVPLNLAKDANVHAQLYDMLGRPVRELHKGNMSAGSHALKIDGANLSTGIYFVHVNVNNAVHVQKIALMK